MAVHYGDNQALGVDHAEDLPQPRHRGDRPVGCGKSTFIRSLNRMNDSIPGFRLDGQVLYHGHDVYGAGVNRVEVRRRIGMVFQKPNPFPKSIYDNVAWAPRNLGMKDELDERVERALQPGGAVGRGQGSPARQRARPLRRPAAAAVHRARDRGRARRAAARRAGLGARPDRDGVDRGADARAQEPLHDRDRHPQHAAGGARRRPDGVLQPRSARARRNADRVRRHARRSSAARATRGRATTSPASSADRAISR